MCMSFVAVGRSVTIVSYVAFKMAALWFWTMFNCNPPIAHCHPLLWGGGILVDHWSTISSSLWQRSPWKTDIIQHADAFCVTQLGLVMHKYFIYLCPRLLYLLTTARCGSRFECIISKFFMQKRKWCHCCAIALRWMAQNLNLRHLHSALSDHSKNAELSHELCACTKWVPSHDVIGNPMAFSGDVMAMPRHSLGAPEIPLCTRDPTVYTSVF